MFLKRGVGTPPQQERGTPTHLSKDKRGTHPSLPASALPSLRVESRLKTRLSVCSGKGGIPPLKTMRGGTPPPTPKKEEGPPTPLSEDKRGTHPPLPVRT